MKNIAYYTDGKGRWLRREWKHQCTARVFLSGRCQGVKGHKGLHWCYSPSGDFDWDDNDDDPKENGCSGSTPPGAEGYVSPVKMEKHYYMSHHTDTEVTDKAVIAQLDKGNPPEKNASIDRPVTDIAVLDILKDRIPKPRASNIKPVKSKPRGKATPNRLKQD